MNDYQLQNSAYRLALISTINAPLISAINIDGEMALTDINSRFMRFLEKLGPFESGNMRPKFVSKNYQSLASRDSWGMENISVLSSVKMVGIILLLGSNYLPIMRI